MTRRQERWSDRWAVAIMVALGTALIAIWCVVKADGDFGEFAGRFSVLLALLGLVVLLSLWEKRSRDKANGAAWKRVCHVLDGEHSHEGTMLTGTWKGRPFRAWANAYMPEPNTGMVQQYCVAMPAEHEGPAWKAERAATQSRGAHLWTLQADTGAKAGLAEAGRSMPSRTPRREQYTSVATSGSPSDRTPPKWPTRTTAASHRAQPIWSSTSTSSGSQSTPTPLLWRRERVGDDVSLTPPASASVHQPPDADSHNHRAE